MYALDEASHAGHLYLPQDELCRQAGKLLLEGCPRDAVAQERIAAQIYALSMRRELIVTDGAVYHQRFYTAETHTAEAVAALAQQPVKRHPNLDAVLAQSQREQGLMLSARQCEAVRCCM